MECPKLIINTEDVVAQNFNTDVLKNSARNAGIPEKFINATFANTKNSAITALESFLRASKGVLIVNGRNGTGKTRTACSAMNWRIENGLNPGLFISCNYQVCPMIRSSRSFRSEKSEYEILEEYYTSPFVVLDEVGKGDDAVISKMFVTNVLSARYDNDLPTLITTNFTKQELIDFVGTDIHSRFIETASIVVLNEMDYRKGE